MSEAITSTPSQLRAFHRLILSLFAAAACAFVLQSTPLQSANDRSRWSTVWSLVERGTYQIDEIDSIPGWTTIDKVRHRRSESDDWHTYSTKPPLTPTLVAGVYYGVKKVTGYGLFRQTKEASRAILLIVNMLPMLIALTLFSRLIQRHCENTIGGLLVLAVACFGTLLTPFITTFNNHTIAATGVFFVIYFAARILLDGSERWWHYAAVGFFAMWVCCNELPAALFGLLFFGILLRHDAGRTLRFFVPAAVVPLAGFIVANYAATGGWKPFYMYYGTDRYVYTVDGVPSYWSEPRGLDANGESPLVYFMHCVVGHHGILSLTPVFLLSLISVLKPGSWRHRLRPFLMPASLLTVAILGFYLSRTQNYNYGGTSAGLRWAFWLIPFWLTAMIPLIDSAWPRRGFRAVAVGLFVASAVTALASVSNPWSHPWLYNKMRKRGWINYSTPGPKLERKMQSWLSDLPELAEGDSARVIFESDDTPALTRTLTATGRSDSIELAIDSPGEPVANAVFSVDRTRLLAGEPPKAFLTRVEGTNRPELERMLIGLPAPTRFKARRVRYLKTLVRTDAFKCVHASATVFERARDRSHRCDVWLSPDVPFGVVRVRTTVTDLRTAEILSRQTWTLTAIEAPED